MKKILVILIVVLLFVISSKNVVSADDSHPVGDGWECKKVKEGVSTIGKFLTVEFDFSIEKIWVDGLIIVGDTSEEDVDEELYYVIGMGSKTIRVYSDDVSISELCAFSTPSTSTPTATATSTSTATPTVTATPTSTATATPTMTATPVLGQKIAQVVLENKTSFIGAILIIVIIAGFIAVVAKKKKQK